MAEDRIPGTLMVLVHVTSSKDTIMETVHDTCRNNGLVRPREGRVLGGVCSGLGQRFGLDPWPARALFTLLVLVLPGTPILLYPILWILMPSADAAPVGPSVSFSKPAPAGPEGPSSGTDWPA